VKKGNAKDFVSKRKYPNDFLQQMAKSEAEAS